MNEYLKDDAFGAGYVDKPDTETIDDNPEFVYSLDEETFYNDFDEVMDMVNDDMDNEPGDRIIIYRGTPVKVTHMDFLKDLNLVDILQNAAYEEDGEMAEDYMMDVSEDDEAEMILEINKIVSEYASQPGYYRVADIKPITVIVGEFE